MVSLSKFDWMPCRHRSKYKWDFTTVRACGGNHSVRASCHVLGVQCFPVWLGWCLQLLMDSQRWAVCDAHPAEPPLTDPQGDNWLLSSITHLVFQMAFQDSQAVVAAAAFSLLLFKNIPQRGYGRFFSPFCFPFFMVVNLKKMIPLQVGAVCFYNQWRKKMHKWRDDILFKWCLIVKTE